MINPEDGASPNVSRSTRRKSYGKGHKMYRPFGVDDPEGSIEMLIERYGQITIGQIFSKLTGCVIAFSPEQKLNASEELTYRKKQQNNNPVNPVMLRAFMSNMKKIKEADP